MPMAAVTLPEILAWIINKFFEGENRSSKALIPLSLSFRSASEISRVLQFYMVTISTYLDVNAYRRMAAGAPRLLKYARTLRAVRLGSDLDENTLDDLYERSCVVRNPYQNCQYSQFPQV